MTYYNSIKQLKNDFRWLSKDCTLEHFSLSRLSEYDYKNISKWIVHRVDDSFVEGLFNQLLSRLRLQSSAWESELTSPMLPALALIPGIGMQVIIDIDVNGNCNPSNNTCNEVSVTAKYSKFSSPPLSNIVCNFD